MSIRPLICISLTRTEYETLATNGPRRDIAMLATRSGGELLFRRATNSGRGLWTKLFGPHFGHAREAAARVRRGGVVFADGEHVGLPLAAFLALSRKRDVRLVILGHYVDKPWKRLLFWVAARLVNDGTLVLHSRSQADSIRSALPPRWRPEILPYQVDATFWSAQSRTSPRALVVSAGSENRDYQTLIEAVQGLDADVCIASGSHWAREQATAKRVPANVRLLTETLSFSDLRDLYQRATVVVIPLHSVSNQSGITTILEAMSMAKPVVVSATPGQREAITGPIINRAGRGEANDRGPHVLGLSSDHEPTGLYVPTRDPQALRHALQKILGDTQLAESLGSAARASVLTNFTVERFAERFAAVLNYQNPAVGPVGQEVPVS